MCKVSLCGAWINRKEVMDGVMIIRSEKPIEYQYRERYVRFLERKRIEWHRKNNFEEMLEQMNG